MMNNLVLAKDKSIQNLIDRLQSFSPEVFNKTFYSDENCLSFLFELFYSCYTKCPYCLNKFKYVLLSEELVYQCMSCSCIIDPKVDTPFEDSFLTLTMWFRELYSMKEYPLMQKIELIRLVNL
jgi:hypothetical protein